MIGKNTKRVLLVMLAALFVMAFAYQAYAFESEGNTPFTYSGTISALDNGGRILTVQAGPDAEMSFNLEANSEVLKCGMAASIDDLRIGDQVSVSYYDKGDGTLVANGIDFWAAGMRHC